MATEYKKPLPRFSSKYGKAFYDGCKQHELLIQKCSSCGKHRFPPQLGCPWCGSTESTWAKSNGKGKVYTFTIITHFEPRAVPMASWPPDEYPINVIIVELEDVGVKIVSNLIDCKPEDIKAGMPVTVVYTDVTPEVTLPYFRPA
ncbi:MAG: OB-fold domain-containing protein [Dehalococcoidia bacterium]|jgi:uncharacterized OB-fold protein